MNHRNDDGSAATVDWKGRYHEEKAARQLLLSQLIALVEKSETSPISKEELLQIITESTTPALTPSAKSFDFDVESMHDEQPKDDTFIGNKLLRPRCNSDMLSDRQSVLLLPPSSTDSNDVLSSPTDPHINGSSSLAHSAASRVMLHMLHSRGSSKSLWEQKNQHDRRHQMFSVAKAVLFTVQARKDCIFEHFFVAGISSPLEARHEQSYVPETLYQFPSAMKSSVNEKAIPQFCFPQGVPVHCLPESFADFISGSLVSKWTLESSKLHERINNSSKQTELDNCYTFRLTGSKGEALYGFCATILHEIDEVSCFKIEEKVPKKFESHPTAAKKSKRVSFLKRHGIFKNDSFPPVKLVASEKQKVLIPRCYCITSKYPFYKLHFQILREIISIMCANERLRRKEDDSPTVPKCFDVTITSTGSLGIVLRAVGASNLKTDSTRQALSRIASPLQRSSTEVSQVVEDTVLPRYQDVSDRSRRSVTDAPETPPVTKPRSSSWSASNNGGISSIISSTPKEKSTDFTGYVVVHSLEADGSSPDWHQQISPGDFLSAVNGESTEHLSFSETVKKVVESARPLTLTFYRPTTCYSPNNNSTNNSASSRRSCDKEEIENARAEIEKMLLHLRHMEIKQPGEFCETPVNVQHISKFRYKFPKDNPEKWACAVALRRVHSINLVKIIMCTLLEEKVVICSNDTALVSAVSTAIMNFLKPYQWESTFIPVLPSNLIEFLHSPVPYVLGATVLSDTTEWPDVCFLNLDSNELTLPSYFTNGMCETGLPYGSKLVRQLDQVRKELRTTSSESTPWHEVSCSEMTLLDAALDTLEITLSLLCSNVKKFCVVKEGYGKRIAPNGQPRIEYTFLLDKFLDQANSTETRDFLKAFTETQIFSQHCDRVLEGGI